MIIENGCLRAEILPELGGGLARLDAIDGHSTGPILRPWSGDGANPVDRACFVMLPWCNRISDGGLKWAGRHYPLPLTVPGQAMPIHGFGLNLSWTVMRANVGEVCLALADKTCPPFDYAAELRYRIVRNALFMTLRLTHRGVEPAPYGLGFHPWFATGPRTRLKFDAQALVLEDEQHLPIGAVASPDPRATQFGAMSPVPPNPFNGTFLGWRGAVTLLDTPSGLVRIRARGATRHLHVFSRAPMNGFICLEPVSQCVDAVNRPVAGEAVTILDRGQVLTATCLIVRESGNR